VFACSFVLHSRRHEWLKPSIKPPEAEVEEISTDHLLIDPSLDDGRSETPKLSNMEAWNLASSREFLERFWMHFHHCGRFRRIQERLRNKVIS
jgi:hypothetical protein